MATKQPPGNPMGKMRCLKLPEISQFIHLEAEQVLKQIPGLRILCLRERLRWLFACDENENLEISDSSAEYTRPAERLGVLRGWVAG